MARSRRQSENLLFLVILIVSVLWSTSFQFSLVRVNGGVTSSRMKSELKFFRKAMDDDEKQRMFEEQQAILARRKDPNKQKKYFSKVEERRQALDKSTKEKILKDDGKDPLVQWKAKRKSGVIKDFEYDESPEGSLPLPASPIQIPRFDNGERFDLRLPYVDRGYEDPDADVMGKIASFFGGGGGKEAETKSVKAAKSTKQAKASKASVQKKSNDIKQTPKKKGWWQ